MISPFKALFGTLPLEHRVAKLEHEMTQVRDHVNLPASNRFENAKAIARWNVIPFQFADNELAVGVVAFHGAGIARVDFSVADKPIASIAEPSLNPRTGVVEYWTTFTTEMVGEGLIEITAKVVPNAGTPRLLAGSMESDLNRRNGNYALPIVLTSQVGPVVYCSGDGDDAAGDGSEARPFRSVAHAADRLGEQAGGATIRLLPGDYTWGGVNRPYPQTGPRWLTIEAAPDVSRELVRFTDFNPAGFRTLLLRARNLTISGDYLLRGDGEGYLWVDSCRLIGPGRDQNSGFFKDIWWRGIYFTNCEVTNNRNGIRGADLIRDCTVHDISGSPFGDSPFVVNCRTFGYDNGGTKFHGDVFHWFPKQSGLENVIVFGLTAFDFPTQGLFGEVFRGKAGEAVDPDDAARRMDNIAFVDVKIWQGIEAPERRAAAGSWWELSTDHFLLWNVDLPDQPMRLVQSQYSTKLTNVSVRGGRFMAFTHDPFPPESEMINVTILEPRATSPSRTK